MKTLSLTVLGAKNIKVDFQNNSPNLDRLDFDMQQRHNLFMVFKESIHNIVKHSHASLATIHIAKQDKMLAIQIKDNGVGFDPTLLTTGNGLGNFQERAKDNFMEVVVDTTQGEGTAINISIFSLK